jgi:nucleoside-diphosphate-sugar epimerase
LRLAAVYGARVKGNYQRLLAALARGRFLPIGKGATRRTLVYDRDVAAAALLVLYHPAAAGQIYNVTDGDVHTLHEITLAICAALNRRPPRLHIPVPPVRLLVALLEDALALAGRTSPLGRATLDKYLEEMIVDGSCLQQTLGFTPGYSLAAGWAEVVHQQRNLDK